jgi:hypothetical protein
MRITIILAGALLAAAGAFAADCTGLDKKVAAASTPAQHEAIAKCYDARAKVVRASVEEYKRLAAAYRDYKRAPMGKSQLWAEAFAKTLDAEGQTYDSMAAAHRELAKAPKADGSPPAGDAR